MLDKWQQRQAQQYADEHGITYEEAVAILFPDTAEVPAHVVTDQAEAPEGDAPEAVTTE